MRFGILLKIEESPGGSMMRAGFILVEADRLAQAIQQAQQLLNDGRVQIPEALTDHHRHLAHGGHVVEAESDVWVDAERYEQAVLYQTLVTEHRVSDEELAFVSLVD